MGFLVRPASGMLQFMRTGITHTTTNLGFFVQVDEADHLIACHNLPVVAPVGVVVVVLLSAPFPNIRVGPR